MEQQLNTLLFSTNSLNLISKIKRAALLSGSFYFTLVDTYLDKDSSTFFTLPCFNNNALASS